MVNLRLENVAGFFIFGNPATDLFLKTERKRKVKQELDVIPIQNMIASMSHAARVGAGAADERACLAGQLDEHGGSERLVVGRAGLSVGRNAADDA